MIPNDSKDYYPTPPALAAELLADLKIDGHSIEYAGGPILEPSAGSGDLARAIEKAADIHYNSDGTRDDYYSTGNKYRLDALQLDCIEQSAALRATLKENGFRVIHDDFLTFTPRAHYKAIIMNPPFSEGARHLLHALHIMERGGEVRCILNAETIRNPCTNERKELAALLAKYNARITYKQGAFTHAARKTSVEVALVFVTIPPAPPRPTWLPSSAVTPSRQQSSATTPPRTVWPACMKNTTVFPLCSPCPKSKAAAPPRPVFLSAKATTTHCAISAPSTGSSFSTCRKSATP